MSAKGGPPVGGGTRAGDGPQVLLWSRAELSVAAAAALDRAAAVLTEAGVRVERAPLPTEGRRRTHGWRNAVDTVRYAIDDLAGDARFADARSVEKLAALRTALATLEAETPLLLSLLRIG